MGIQLIFSYILGANAGCAENGALDISVENNLIAEVPSIYTFWKCQVECRNREQEGCQFLYVNRQNNTCYLLREYITSTSPDAPECGPEPDTCQRGPKDCPGEFKKISIKCRFSNYQSSNGNYLVKIQVHFGRLVGANECKI